MNEYWTCPVCHMICYNEEIKKEHNEEREMTKPEIVINNTVVEVGQIWEVGNKGEVMEILTLNANPERPIIAINRQSGRIEHFTKYGQYDYRPNRAFDMIKLVVPKKTLKTTVCWWRSEFLEWVDNNDIPHIDEEAKLIAKREIELEEGEGL